MAALNTTRGVRSPRRGAALMEAAIVLPLVLLLLFGVIEYGWLFLKSQQINNACREGARVGVRHGSVGADVTSAVQNSLQAVGLESSAYSITMSPGDPGTIDRGDPFTVTITVPYEGTLSIGVPFIPVPATLQATVVMAREGPP